MSSASHRISSKQSWHRRASGAAVRALIEPLEKRTLLSGTPLLKPDHIVVVIESDRFTNAIGDTTNLPYVNQLASGSLVLSSYQGVNVSTVGGETNYLALYSGSDQGVIDNARGYTFTGPNLAQTFNSTTGLSFAGYSESLPSDGSQVQQAGDATYLDLYTRNHNPMAMFTAVGTGKTSADVNKTFESFKAFATAANTYANLPTLSFVIPNNLDNTNGSNEAAPFSTDTTAYAGLRQRADTWLKQNLDTYAQWAKTHNSLLIIVGNEGDRQRTFAAGTQTIIFGDPRLVVPGTDTNSFNHYNTLRTIEDMYGSSLLGNSATATELDSNAAGQLAAPGTVAASTAVLTSSANPSVAGQAVLMTATISPTVSNLAVPTGTVTFLDGTTVIGIGMLNASGVATLSTSTLSAATHSITASYAGDAKFVATTSPILSQVVNQPVAAATTIVVTAAVNPAVFGQTVSFTATVASSGAGTLTGTVNFMDGATSLGTATLNASGVATFSTTSLSVASHLITGVYSGDANFISSTSPTFSEVVNKASTTARLSSSSNPATVGQAVSFTVIVASTLPGSGAPTGTVQFLIDGANFGSPVTLTNGGATSPSTASLAAGNHTVTAFYAGDNNFTTSNAPGLTQVIGQASIVRPDHIVVLIEEDRAASALGDPNLPYLNQLAAGGLVFSNSQGLNTSAQLGEMNYLALFSGSTQGVVDDSNSYSFAGPNLAKSLNSTAGLSFVSYAESLPSDGSQVLQASDGTHPDLYTRSYNAAAMFTDAGTGKTNADINKTFDGFKSLTGLPNTYANLPTVSFVVPNNLNNSHGSNESAPFATDPSVYDLLRHSADTWLQQNIDAYVQWAKTHNSLLIITGDEGDRAHNFAKGVTTIVTGDPRLFVPGTDATSINHYNLLRTIEDMYGVTPLGNSAGVSHLDVNALGQLAAPVGQLTSTTAVTSSANPSVTNQVVTFTATVTGAGTPTGSVTFKDGTNILGSASLNASGVAVYTTSTLTVATHSITAIYAGDSTFKTSTSASLSQVVTAVTAPVNDNFANRITLTGTTATNTGTNVNATKQTGEPKHAGATGGKSVWWTWTAPSSGTVTINTTGSSFDTLLAVYTGTSVNALTSVPNGSNDDNPAGGTYTSLVKFPVTSGVVYQIAVDGYNALAGNITLHVNLTVPVPTVPTNVTATKGTVSDRVHITWTIPTGATGFEVYRSTMNNSGTAVKITTTDATGSFFDDLTAASGTTYYYWVKAKNSSGTSGFSAAASGYRP